jgi:hypothetical protein
MANSTQNDKNSMRCDVFSLPLDVKRINSGVYGFDRRINGVEVVIEMRNDRTK